jgi:hypothetical protein
VKRVLITIVVLLAVTGVAVYTASNTNTGLELKKKFNAGLTTIQAVGSGFITIAQSAPEFISFVKEYDPSVLSELVALNKEQAKSLEELQVFVKEQNNHIKELEQIVQESNKKSEEILANLPELSDSIPQTLDSALVQIEQARYIIEQQKEVISEKTREAVALRAINQSQGLIIERYEVQLEKQSEVIDKFMVDVAKVRRQIQVRDGIIGVLILGLTYTLATGS